MLCQAMLHFSCIISKLLEQPQDFMLHPHIADRSVLHKSSSQALHVEPGGRNQSPQRCSDGSACQNLRWVFCSCPVLTLVSIPWVFMMQLGPNRQPFAAVLWLVKGVELRPSCFALKHLGDDLPKRHYIWMSTV